MSNNDNIVLAFDTETTGLVNSRIIQLSFVLYDTEKEVIIFSSKKNNDYVLLPEFYNSKDINETWFIDRKEIEDRLMVRITDLEKQKQTCTRNEYKKKRECLEENVIKESNNIIPFSSTISHHIFDSTLYKYGRHLNVSMNEFIKYFYMAGIIAGHNISFDIKMICIELIHLLDEKNMKITNEERISYIQLFYDLIENVDDRENAKDLNFHKERSKLFEMFKTNKHVNNMEFEKNKNKNKNETENKRIIYCTMKKSTMICRLRQAFEYKKTYSAYEIKMLEGSLDQLWKLYKSPQLAEAHKIIFSENVCGQLHDSMVDVAVTLRLFMKLYKNIDICNYASRVKMDNNIIFGIIKPEDITDSRDFPIQIFFKKMEKNDRLFYIDDPFNNIKQTKETKWKIEENRLREIINELKLLLPIKIIEMKKMNHHRHSIHNVISLPIKQYSKANPRRNPRRNANNKKK